MAAWSKHSACRRASSSRVVGKIARQVEFVDDRQRIDAGLTPLAEDSRDDAFPVMGRRRKRIISSTTLSSGTTPRRRDRRRGSGGKTRFRRSPPGHSRRVRNKCRRTGWSAAGESQRSRPAARPLAAAGEQADGHHVAGRGVLGPLGGDIDVGVLRVSPRSRLWGGQSRTRPRCGGRCQPAGCPPLWELQAIAPGDRLRRRAFPPRSALDRGLDKSPFRLGQPEPLGDRPGFHRAVPGLATSRRIASLSSAGSMVSSILNELA